MLNLNGQFNLQQDIRCGDKSVSHRALIVASVAEGKSTVRNLSLCRDVLATVECLRKLGAEIELNGTVAEISPIVSPVDGVTLDCKNSGTTARLLAGVVAGLGVSARFVGDESLSRRPMDRVLKPLSLMGANVSKPKGTLFAVSGSRLQGRTIRAEVDSAQVKSAVLLAGMFAYGETTYVERLSTRNHTELLLSRVGVDISFGEGITVRRSKPRGFDVEIPNDASSAAFSAVLALLTGKELTLRNVLLNKRRTGYIDILAKSGADISAIPLRENYGEIVGDVKIVKSRIGVLTACKQEVCDAIDEIILLCAAACATCGEHRFSGVGELRNKESDRISAITDIAKSCGQRAYMQGDELVIISNGILPERPRFTSFGDHRAAMSEAVLSLANGGGSVDETPFDVSYPNFLQSLGVVPLKLGLIGESVERSVSPILMRYLSANSSVCCSYDAVSLPKDIEDARLIERISSFDGVNITMPFKRKAAELLESKYPSVNTAGAGIEPQSTDGYGIVKALRRRGVDFAGKTMWIVGAGGAAEECIITLRNFGCEMFVVNRTAEHAERLTEKYGLLTDCPQPFGVLSFVPECEFERNLTLPESASFVFIASYTGESGLRKQAEQRGLTVVGGLEMLYHQGAKSFSLWTDTPAQDDYDGFEQFIQTIG